MEILEGLGYLNMWLWSGPLLLLIFGTGIYLTYALKGFQIRYLGYAFQQVLAKKRQGARGDISQLEALMTSLAGAIGTGSIVGVATAIAIGGLGSIFWMWVTAILGMATKYAESLLAVKYRHMDKRGEMIGGPMHYMEKGLGWRKVALLFAGLGCIAAIGTGNLVQVNAIVEGVYQVWQVPPLMTGFILLSVTALVLLGGIRTIGSVATVLVPIMALFYIGGGSIILFLKASEIPKALWTIITSAFTGQAAVGAFAGSSIILAMQLGVARSILSNEAGLGISSIAAAAAITDSPARQGMITMTGALISTLIVCTFTALVIAVTGVLGQVDADGKVLNGAAMAIRAFESSLSGGQYVVSIGLMLFAYTTILAWAYYGEKCFEYIFGERSVPFYRALFVLLMLPGAVLQLHVVWLVADLANAFMVVPNLIALLALARVVTKETEVFLGEQQNDLATEAISTPYIA